MATDVYARRSMSPSGRNEPSFGRSEDSWGGRDQGGRSDPYRRPHDRRPRGGRMRSRSPMQIDRYQPGRRDDGPGPGRRDDYRRRSPAHGSALIIDRYVPGQEPPPPPVVNPLPNPLSIDYPVGFNFFAEWWRKDQAVKTERERQKTGIRRPADRLKGEKESREEREKERGLIQTAYDEYKEKLQAQMAKTFVIQHKGEEWFKERYDPEVQGPFRGRQSAFRRGCYEQWESDLQSGAFDSFTLEGIYKNESDGAGGTIDKEEGETTAAAEVLGVSDLVPSKGGDLRDEAALRPTLLIKTIAPHVSREKMEAFCKEHLGEGEGGFKWLSLSDPNPQKKCHRIGWVLLNPGGEVVEEVKTEERGDGRDEEEGEDGEQDEDKMDTGAAVSVTKSAAEQAVSEINGKPIVDEEKGNFTCHVGVHTPQAMPRKKALWDLFSAPERIERDLQLSMRLVTKFEQELGEDVNGVNKIEERVEELRSQGILQPVKANGTKTEKDVKPEVEDDEEGQMDEDEDEGVYDEETDDEELLTKKKKLDMLVEYLRRVYNFCFFCVCESDSVHELARKCPGGHLRRPRASLTTSAKAAAKASAYGEELPLMKKQDQTEDQENEDGSPKVVKQSRFQKNNKTHQQLQRAFNWVKTYEDKLFQILEPEAADLKKLGGRPLEEGLDEELKKFVKQEDEAKFRCKVPDCTKLFKGEVFWRKHAEKRHTEWFESIKSEAINSYVLDPAHITAFKNDGSNLGHFGANPHMQAGTPRGFNLQNMPFNVPPMMAGMPNPGAFGTNMGAFPMPMPGAFGSNGMGFGMDGGVGPMRRGGGRFGPRSGPYDRQNRDNRGPRFGGHSGRLTPPRGGRVTNGPQRFPDAVPAVGPKEAVAGRSLKSYEDLDAVGGQGDGQLDY
ncbi:MAG: hypothetical protein M1828_006341 [Chrysothrix sp. TS-e1954]|nr:MAG: hypothetical protein M1828_006341 [Chrysothrix sp. TS-e1954]